MFKPIVIVEENDESTVYEYKTVFLWTLYAIVFVILLGYVSHIQIVSIAGMSLMAVYFLTVSIPYIIHGKEIKKAARQSGVHFSGNKWSFKNPLHVTIPKQ